MYGGTGRVRGEARMYAEHGQGHGHGRESQTKRVNSGKGYTRRNQTSAGGGMRQDYATRCRYERRETSEHGRREARTYGQHTAARQPSCAGHGQPRENGTMNVVGDIDGDKYPAGGRPRGKRVVR